MREGLPSYIKTAIMRKNPPCIKAVRLREGIPSRIKAVIIGCNAVVYLGGENERINAVIY